MTKPLLLIIEDEPDITELVQYNATRNGFEVVSAATGEEGLRLARKRHPALVLLDLMLPGVNGLDVCRQLKAQPSSAAIPIIILTAKGEESDVIIGLEMGADDYVTKPFSPRELVARIRAVLRRKQDTGPVDNARITCGPITIDSHRHEVLVGNRAVPFTLTEFRLLRRLLAHPGQVFTRDQLLDTMTGGDGIIIDRNVDVHIRSVRKKLGTHEALILTVRGVGYKCTG